jgi:hypothetical protein
MKQKDIAEILGLKPAEVSHLFNGHFSRFSTDKRLGLLADLEQKSNHPDQPKETRRAIPGSCLRLILVHVCQKLRVDVHEEVFRRRRKLRTIGSAERVDIYNDDLKPGSKFRFMVENRRHRVGKIPLDGDRPVSGGADILTGSKKREGAGKLSIRVPDSREEQ